MYDYYSMGKIPVQASTNVVANSPDLFQKRRNDLFRGFECIRAYIDDLLILTKVYWTYHILWLQLRLNKLERKRT